MTRSMSGKQTFDAPPNSVLERIASSHSLAAAAQHELYAFEFHILRYAPITMGGYPR
jgi:hypothetical protein